MARSSRPTRVFNTHQRTLGSGLQIRDLLPIPTWMWIVKFIVVALFKHAFGITVGLFILYWWTNNVVNYGLSTANIIAAYSVAIVWFCILCLLLGFIYSRYSYGANTKNLVIALFRWYRLKKRWNEACSNVGFRKIPKYKKLQFNPNGITLEVKCGKAGIVPNDYRAGSDEIVGMLEAHEMKVDSNTPSRATLHIMWGDPTSRILRPGDLLDMQPTNQEQFGVVFALNPDHDPVEVPLNTPVAIYGESDSGKSNTVWAILNGLNSLGIPYRVRVIDPAGGVELNEFQDSPLCLDYTDTVPDAEMLITRANKSMKERLQWMKANDITKMESHHYSEETPFDILIIDELLLLKKHDSHSLLGQRLSTGRKAGHTTIGLSQLTQKESVGELRDLFPVRMCHATKSIEMTNAALGPDAEREGAKCSRISKSTPGVGYIYNSTTRTWIRYRAPLIEKAERKLVANGEVITNLSYAISGKVKDKLGKLTKLQLRKTSVYKFFTYDGIHGYTGMAVNFQRRRDQHEDKSWWFPQIDESLTEVEEYSNRKEAKAAESWSIANEKPIFNKAENYDNPDRVTEKDYV